MAASARRRALITGAAGGMGRACARLLGATQDLVLTDAAAPALEHFSEELRGEGYTVFGTHAGDLGSDAVLSAIMAGMAGEAPLTLIHTAGLSPSLADARAIMAVNLVATVKLLDAIQPLLRPGAAAVLIASVAGYMMPPIPAALALMADPLAPGFMDKILGLIDGMVQSDAARARGASYSLSKQAVHGARPAGASPVWGPLGARINSISAGPDSVHPWAASVELAETEGAAMLQNAVPLGRPGVATDIALAASASWLSEEASFISGTDLLVDGGSMAAIHQRA